MNNVANKNASLEILVSTKGQDNTDFINRMFKNRPDLKHPVLIINQSKKKLNFLQNNCRVINTNEIGLSNSRNLAINNSKGEICLLSDDDVIYSSDFVESIKNSFEKNKNAEIITYQSTNELGKLFKDYPKIKTHNKRSISTINSFLIAFRRDSIIKNKIQFDSKFGLGSTFETGDEYIFLRNALEKKLNIIHCPKVILSHKSISSGQVVGKDKIIFARAAIFYKYYGTLSYLKLFHHIILLLNIKAIVFAEFFLKYKIGLKGIKKYKSML
jgi:hypothetical protein